MEQAGAASPNLVGGEREQAAEHAPLRGLVIHEIIREQGEHELKRRGSALFWSALAGGLSMGLSLIALAWMRAALPDTPYRHMISALGYSAGFVAVVLGRQQLFTESTLTAVLPALTEKSARGWAALGRYWAIVLVGNIIGTWLFAVGLLAPGIVEPPVHRALIEVSDELMSHDFWATLSRGVLTGWIIALMVWLLPSARSSRFWVIVFMTWLIGVGQLTHIVAGSAEAAYTVLTGARPLIDYFAVFFIPTLIGNVIGGIALVALLNHAPFSDELREPTNEPSEHGPMAGRNPPA